MTHRLRSYFLKSLLLFTVLALAYSFFISIGAIDVLMGLLKKAGISGGVHALKKSCGFGGILLSGLLTVVFLPDWLSHWMASPSSATSGESSWTRYLESSETRPSADTGSPSVNQLEGHPANPVASPGEAGPSNLRTAPVTPFPYRDDEIIGGDSVESIKWRFVERLRDPSLIDDYLCHIEAQETFEAKVSIIQTMAGLDPRGDWIGRGARALDNPHTSTGEQPIERLSQIRDDLSAHGTRSKFFSELQQKVFLKRDDTDRGSRS
jgi:hypothetical protein